jgi:hypothetical protein
MWIRDGPDGPQNRGSISGGSFSLLHSVLMTCGTHTASWGIGTWGGGAVSPRFVLIALVNDGAIPPLPHTCSWRDA